MVTWTKAVVRLTAALAFVLAGVSAVRAQDSISAARDLYAAANYEEALALLDRLRAAEKRPAEARAIEQYRAFCLLALGRSADAERAIEAVVAAEPSYQPSDEEVSPRVRSAFVDVRRRMLPVIVQQRYASAKSAYDRKAYADAAIGFRQVLDVLDDPALAASSGQPPLSDIRTLAVGFRDLSVTAAAPPPPPPPPPTATPPPAPEPPPAPAPVVERRIYQIGDPGVTPPAIVRQGLPPFPANASMPSAGAIEVVINEAGRVEAAIMREPLTPSYDRVVVQAARNWQYRPATLKGVPVKYRKLVQIAVKR
jgi:hypothetical protein